MVTRSQKIRLGVFLAFSVTALLVVLAVVLVPRYFQERDTYLIGFRDVSVTGLLEGGTVKYHGLNVGFVSRIFIDPQDIRRVIVEISSNPETPIKTTPRRRSLSWYHRTQGDRAAGRRSSLRFLKPGTLSRPAARSPMRSTGKAEVIADKAERVLNNIALSPMPPIATR